MMSDEQRNEISNLHELSLYDVHAVSLEMLKIVDRHCDEHGIRYYLAYGSLLGAVRHKGFIPWDDDADLWFPREDFEKFLDTFKPFGHYRIIKPFDIRYPFSRGKLVDTRICYYNGHYKMPDDYGMTLDLFPLDDSLGLQQRKRARRCAALFEIANSDYRSWANLSWKRRIKKMARPFVRALPDSVYGAKKWDAIAHEGTSDEYVRLGVSEERYPKRHFPKAWFSEGVMVDFEGCQFRVPCNFEDILARCYGENWREPVEYPRHAHVYWRPEFDPENDGGHGVVGGSE